VQGFDEEMRAVEDKLFLMQLAKLGKFGFLDMPLATWRRHNTTTTSGAGNAYRNAFYDDLALEKIEQRATRLGLTADELATIRAQREKNSTGLLYAASNEARPEFFKVVLKLIKEGRAPWRMVPKACLRYGWRRAHQGTSSIVAK